MTNQLADTPIFGIFNTEQTKFIVTSNEDLLYVDMRTK